MLLDVTKRDDFLIASALRGPDYLDIYSYELKQITTAVIRDACKIYRKPDTGISIVSENFCDTSSIEIAKAFWDTLSNDAKLDIAEEIESTKYQHFMDHFKQAAILLDLQDYVNWLNERFYGQLSQQKKSNPLRQTL